MNILFSGDFAPLLANNEVYTEHFSDLQELFKKCDLHVSNLECPLTIADKSIEKTGPSLKANPECIELLKQANVSLACLANNHIFDYRESGITDTLNVCHKNGIDTIGIINRPDNQPHWRIIEIKGKKIGFLNYCEHEFSVRGKGLLGACGYSAIDVFYDIGKLKPQVDYIIVIYHGGNEYYPLPNPDMRKEFRFLADIGADAVIGHHTHVFSGYEMYNGKPLVYSLGNFFFPYSGEPEEWHRGVLCVLEIDTHTKVSLHPIIQCRNNLRVTIPSQDETKRINNEITKLSGILSSDREFANSWNNYVQEKGHGIAKLFLYSTKYEKALLKLRLLNHKKYNLRAMTLNNIVRCSSLRSLLTKSL